ncbi:MAG: hypothetical protein HC929_02920 [Leptolyngbyaceae cyanobacterium SM2_5_2]|nr:hypothetical protein [Leptolyngbyaceae cyanobacterium SM2_5_2]
MVSTAPLALAPQSILRELYLSRAAPDILSQTVCRLAPIAFIGLESSAVSTALEQLIEIIMQLRMPTLGRPMEATLSPQALAPYVSEEVGELLDSLDAWQTRQPSLEALGSADVTVSVPSLIPHLLWVLASSSYEIMHLIEGGRAKLYHEDGSVAVRVIRLVPVLQLTTDSGSYALDLVTQANPLPALYLPSTTSLRLVENDLDSQPIPVGDWLAHILALTRQTQPVLHELLAVGRQVEALIPFQPWQTGTLCLRLYLADTGLGEQPTVPWPVNELPDGLPDESPSVFTLDDFANTLVASCESEATSILGHWLTFTDESWLHRLLSSYAQQVVRQGLPQRLNAPQIAPDREADRELDYVTLAYEAVSLVHGPKGLFKHTFVHEPALIADIWPRLRWCLAQSSERIMQLMGGLQAQVLCPGRGWQPGTLYLCSFMHLTTSAQTWLIDLGNGNLMLTEPPALPAAAVLEITDTSTWASHQTIADLETLVSQDLTRHTPAIVALCQGTTVNLHCLDTKDGYQDARLSLKWCFTWV